MSKIRLRKKKLRVDSAGHVRYIQVPSGTAVALQGYLRHHGIQASPPEPCSLNVDTIGLARGVETKAIQELLDHWSGNPF